jgi:hypothetical protein
MAAAFFFARAALQTSALHRDGNGNFCVKKARDMPGVVTHAFNLSYSGGRNRKITI